MEGAKVADDYWPNETQPVLRKPAVDHSAPPPVHGASRAAVKVNASNGTALFAPRFEAWIAAMEREHELLPYAVLGLAAALLLVVLLYLRFRRYFTIIYAPLPPVKAKPE